MNLHSGLALTDAIIHVLESAGLLVGDGVAPAGYGWQGAPGQSGFTGYVTVYELTGGTLDGTIGLPDDDASLLYQFTATGATRKQCEWVADKARTTILASSLLIAGRQVQRVTVDMLGGTTRDDSVQPPVFFSPDRYRIWTTPA